MLARGLPGRVAAWIAIAVALGLLGAACDQIHVQAGLIRYPDPWLEGQAAWVPLNFAVLLTALVAATIPIARLARRRAPAPRLADARRPSIQGLVVGFAWFAGAYAASGVFGPDHPDLLAAALVALWLVRVALREERAVLVAYSIALAVGGCAVEAIEIAWGWFEYSAPDVAGVPLWLAGIYLHGAPLALDVAARVDDAGLAGGGRSLPSD